VEIVPIRVNEQTTLLLDGQVQRQVQAGDLITIQKHEGQFLVVNNPLRTQWDTLATKLNWAGRPGYNHRSCHNPRQNL
jgi:NAD kinase